MRLSATPLLLLAAFAAACGPAAERAQVQGTTEPDGVRTVVISLPQSGMDADSVKSELESIDRAARQMGLADRSNTVTAPANVRKRGTDGPAHSAAVIASAMGLGGEADSEAPGTRGKGELASSTIATTSVAATVSAVDHIASAAGLPTKTATANGDETGGQQGDSRTVAARELRSTDNPGSPATQGAANDPSAGDHTPPGSTDAGNSDEPAPGDPSSDSQGDPPDPSVGAVDESTGPDAHPADGGPGDDHSTDRARDNGRTDDGVGPDTGRQAEAHTPAPKENPSADNSASVDRGQSVGPGSSVDSGRGAKSSPGEEAPNDRENGARDSDSGGRHDATRDAGVTEPEADAGSASESSETESRPSTDQDSVDSEPDDAHESGGRQDGDDPSENGDDAQSSDDGSTRAGNDDDDTDDQSVEPKEPREQGSGNGTDRGNRGDKKRGGGSSK